MPKMKLKNAATVRLGGKLPGQVFLVEEADDGLPVDPFWRRRILEDRAFHGDSPFVIIMPDTAVPVAPDPEPVPVASPVPDAPAAPAPAAKKGKA